MGRRSKLFEKDGTKAKTTEFESQEQTAPKKIESLRTRSKPSERDN